MTEDSPNVERLQEVREELGLTVADVRRRIDEVYGAFEYPDEYEKSTDSFPSVADVSEEEMSARADAACAITYEELGEPLKGQSWRDFRKEHKGWFDEVKGRLGDSHWMPKSQRRLDAMNDYVDTNTMPGLAISAAPQLCIGDAVMEDPDSAFDFPEANAYEYQGPSIAQSVARLKNYNPQPKAGDTPSKERKQDQPPGGDIMTKQPRNFAIDFGESSTTVIEKKVDGSYEKVLFEPSFGAVARDVPVAKKHAIAVTYSNGGSEPVQHQVLLGEKATKKRMQGLRVKEGGLAGLLLFKKGKDQHEEGREVLMRAFAERAYEQAKIGKDEPVNWVITYPRTDSDEKLAHIEAAQTVFNERTGKPNQHVRIVSELYASARALEGMLEADGCPVEYDGIGFTYVDLGRQTSQMIFVDGVEDKKTEQLLDTKSNTMYTRLIKFVRGQDERLKRIDARRIEESLAQVLYASQVEPKDRKNEKGESVTAHDWNPEFGYMQWEDADRDISGAIRKHVGDYVASVGREVAERINEKCNHGAEDPGLIIFGGGFTLMPGFKEAVTKAVYAHLAPAIRAEKPQIYLVSDLPDITEKLDVRQLAARGAADLAGRKRKKTRMDAYVTE